MYSDKHSFADFDIINFDQFIQRILITICDTNAIKTHADIFCPIHSHQLFPTSDVQSNITIAYNTTQILPKSASRAVCVPTVPSWFFVASRAAVGRALKRCRCNCATVFLEHRLFQLSPTLVSQSHGKGFHEIVRYIFDTEFC